MYKRQDWYNDVRIEQHDEIAPVDGGERSPYAVEPTAVPAEPLIHKPDLGEKLLPFLIMGLVLTLSLIHI